MPTLNIQKWISQLQRNFYPDTSFLNPIPNKSALVNNDKVNLQEAGVDPNVLINNDSYPISVSKRDDNPIEIELDLFETENTLVRRPETIEYSYDQMEDVIKGHRDSLRVKTAERAAQAIAPAADTENTPVIPTTGADNGDGLKRLLPADIIKLKRKFDDLDIPFDMRYLVLHPNHVEELMLYDLDIFKDIVNIVNCQPKNFAGFNIMQFT